LIKQAVGMGTDDEPAPQEEEKPVTDEQEAPRPVLSAPTPEVEDEDDIPMPTSSAPPPPYSTSSTQGGIPMRSARFRRGSRGGARRPGAGGVPEIPKIGVVEVDPTSGHAATWWLPNPRPVSRAQRSPRRDPAASEASVASVAVVGAVGVAGIAGPALRMASAANAEAVAVAVDVAGAVADRVG